MTEQRGWRQLVSEAGWLTPDGRYPLRAYSEFMPAPNVGVRAYDATVDPGLFAGDDPYGWRVSELEQEHELRPGLAHLAVEMLSELHRLAHGDEAHHIVGHRGQNLLNNPAWSPALAAHAGRAGRGRHVVILPLALSRTQDDMGRVRWTCFGGSEQGPERAFWQSFYRGPGDERPAAESLRWISRMLAGASGKAITGQAGLRRAGFRILPSLPDARFPYWHVESLPAWTRPFVVSDGADLDGARHLLTFRPFTTLPERVQQRYLSGDLQLIPFPPSLVLWYMPTYWRLQEQLPFAMQIPLQKLAGRNGGPDGIRVPQSGRLYEPRPDLPPSEVHPALVRNQYQRTSRWDRVHRYENELTPGAHLDKVARVLFSNALDAMGLYNKPMARNAQVWTHDHELLLDGPRATREQIERAAAAVEGGGLFGYRFVFPAMRVGAYEVYWQRPLVAFLTPRDGAVDVLDDAPPGYLTAYRADAPSPARPVELWPRLPQRAEYLSALRDFGAHDYYQHQTAYNILSLLDTYHARGDRALPRSFARHLLRTAKEESIEDWLASLSTAQTRRGAARPMQQALKAIVEPHAAVVAPQSLTYAQTATREFEEALWNEIHYLSNQHYITKDNADVVHDEQTLSRLAHHQRDLERLGDYLLERHRRAIAGAGLAGQARAGELPFQWRTDFTFPLFGGWQRNQDGQTHERDILVVIPGRDRGQAVVLADHYDTAYMEDLYDPARGGTGVRMAAHGADDDHSATATLLLAAPILLALSKAGRLARDVWLLHLTGEEFPADCLGARHFCEALVERALQLHEDGATTDLSSVRVAGLYVMDMIAHNRDHAQDIFQIAPGRSRASLELAWHAHVANLLWNAHVPEWNRSPERRGRGRGQRSADGHRIPDVAAHLSLHGEVRTADDPQSSLYNTDGQIFSDVGVPAVLFMENYDINRVGYHDTHDTMENIDLDYGAAFAAIAIETVARVAAAP